MSSEALPGLAHHFDSYDQQRESASLGMWLFLAQEVMFFGGLFVGYVVYRWQFPQAWAYGSATLDIDLGFFNTLVLIASSLTMALAVRAAQLAQKNQIVGFLLATIVLGSIFLGVKVVEYKHKIDHHLIPGTASFEVPALEHPPAHAPVGSVARPHLQMFFLFYFGMTGLHAAHMIAGIALLFFLAYHASKGRYTPANHNWVEGVGLYWHFVDIIWIFLFPLLYLIGRH